MRRGGEAAPGSVTVRCSRPSDKDTSTPMVCPEPAPACRTLFVTSSLTIRPTSSVNGGGSRSARARADMVARNSRCVSIGGDLERNWKQRLDSPEMPVAAIGQTCPSRELRRALVDRHDHRRWRRPRGARASCRSPPAGWPWRSRPRSGSRLDRLACLRPSTPNVPPCSIRRLMTPLVTRISRSLRVQLAAGQRERGLGSADAKRRMFGRSEFGEDCPRRRPGRHRGGRS